jgi:hypothetical protein
MILLTFPCVQAPSPVATANAWSPTLLQGGCPKCSQYLIDGGMDNQAVGRWGMVLASSEAVQPLPRFAGQAAERDAPELAALGIASLEADIYVDGGGGGSTLAQSARCCPLQKLCTMASGHNSKQAAIQATATADVVSLPEVRSSWGLLKARHVTVSHLHRATLDASRQRDRLCSEVALVRSSPTSE